MLLGTPRRLQESRLGGGGSKVVKSMPYGRDVVGLNPGGGSIFPNLYPISNATLIEVPRVGTTLLIFF